MTLAQAERGQRYEIADIRTQEEGMRKFLFSLGCYPGENVTVISQLASNFIINIKDSRYSIDENLASAIRINHEFDENNDLQRKFA